VGSAPFDATWLALREPADAAARADELAVLVARALPTDGLRAVDLASGTGANVRHLIARMPSPQQWLLAETAVALLSALPDAMARWATARAWRVAMRGAEVDVAGAAVVARLVPRQVNLAAPAAVDTVVNGRHLVTASALLDLVSAKWLGALLARCHDAGAAVLFALTYDGRVSCEPEDTDDARVRGLVNLHQRGDKGFGPALGPAAPATAVRMLRDLGYVTRQAPSDWRLGARDSRLQRQLIDGWAAAANETPTTDRAAVGAWRARRLAHVEAGRSTITVGHQDVAAWLP
jgi:hypothetical protein